MIYEKKYRRFVCKIGTWSEKRMSAEKVLRLAWVIRNSTESSPWICSRLAAIAIALSFRQYNTLHTSQLKAFPSAHLKWNGRVPSLSLLSSLWKVPFVLHIYLKIVFFMFLFFNPFAKFLSFLSLYMSIYYHWMWSGFMKLIIVFFLVSKIPLYIKRV